MSILRHANNHSTLHRSGIAALSNLRSSLVPLPYNVNHLRINFKNVNGTAVYNDTRCESSRSRDVDLVQASFAKIYRKCKRNKYYSLFFLLYYIYSVIKKTWI